MITTLTAEQKARFPEFCRKWIDIGLSTQPADRHRAERAIAGLYALAKLKEPRVIWLPCPVSAALSAVCYAKLIHHRLDDGGKSAVYSAVGSAVYSAVYSAVGSAVDSAVGSAVYSAVGSAVDSAVYSAVGSAVGSAVYSAVGSAVDSAVYSAVGSAVGSAVYSAVGSAVDSAVYSAVGSAVYSAVGSAVYSAVGSAVDSAVGSAVDSAGYSFFGGSLLNAGYAAWADYFNEVLAVSVDRNFLDMVESAGFYWTLDGVCFASERPSRIMRNQAGRLHCEDAMAISYSGTGWGLYYWHGHHIPNDHAWIITKPTLITAEAIQAEPNAELRRIMCERTEFRPIRSIAKVLSSDTDGNGHPRSLLQAKIGRESVRFIEVQNGSLEPDGSRRKFLLGAMPGKTPQECVAASYGISSKVYKEAVRT